MNIGLILKYLPQLIELLLAVVDFIKREKNEMVVRGKIKGISSAFKEPEPIKRAKLLNDVFRD